MRKRASGSLVLFSFAAAVLAAALIDPIVEGLSNAGCFGPGDFTDHSNANLIPTLAVAALFSVAFIVIGVRSWFSRSHEAPDWLRQCAAMVDARSVCRLLPAIFGTQIGVLFVMETLEQSLVQQRLLGGWIWLGAPIAISLAMHLAGGAAVSFVLARFLHCATARVVETVRFALRVLRLVPHGCEPSIRVLFTTLQPVTRPFCSTLSERAPPLPSL